MATVRDLEIEAGSQFIATFIYCDPLVGSYPEPVPDPARPVNVTGWTARMQIRSSFKGGRLLADASSAAGTIIVGSSPGEFIVTLTPDATRALTNGVYDLLASPPFPSTQAQRVAQGAVTVSPVVTAGAA